MASRRLEDLDKRIQPLAARFIVECKKISVEILIYCTFRSKAEQVILYAQGRTTLGPKVTWTLDSKHNHMEDGKPAALAFDCVPLVLGKPVWNDKATYEKMGKIGESIGLTWGGRWKGRDTPHFEI